MTTDTNKPKPRRYFLCTGHCVEYKDLHMFPDSHIIGHLRHVIDEGHKVTALARWEVSPRADQVPPLEPVIDLDIIGDARNIKCRYPGCERVEKWEIGKAAFMVLMSRYEEIVKAAVTVNAAPTEHFDDAGKE